MNRGAKIGHELTDKSVQLVHFKSRNLCCTHWIYLPFRFDSGFWSERLAGNFRVPAHERAVRIILPRPDMQDIECREPEAIGGFPIMKELSHEFRRTQFLLIP